MGDTDLFRALGLAISKTSTVAFGTSNLITDAIWIDWQSPSSLACSGAANFGRPSRRFFIYP